MKANKRTLTYDELCLIDPDAETALLNYAIQRTKMMRDPTHALDWVMNRLNKRFKNHKIYCYEQDAWDRVFWFQTYKAKGEYYKNFELKDDRIDLDQVDCESGFAEEAMHEYAAEQNQEHASELLDHCMHKDHEVLSPKEAQTHRILRKELTKMLCELRENPRREANAVAVEALARNTGMAKSTAQERIHALRTRCAAARIAEDDVAQQIEPSSGGSCPSSTENEQQE